MAAEITGDSPQAVALRLLGYIATAEGKILGNPQSSPDRKWILSTYEQCIAAVLSQSRWGPWSTK